MYRSVNFIAYHICNISMTYPRISMHNNRYPQMKQGDIMKVYASKRNLIWWCNLMQIAITHNCDFHAAYNCISFMLWTFVILNLTKQLEISISFLMYNDKSYDMISLRYVNWKNPKNTFVFDVSVQLWDFTLNRARM